MGTGRISLEGFAAFSYFMVIAILKCKVPSIWQRLRKKPLTASKFSSDAQKHYSGGDGQQNKKGIDMLRMGLAGAGRGKNGHLKVVVSASALEGAIGEQPLHSGGLANGSGAGGVDPTVKNAPEPSLYGHKVGSCKEKEEMAFGEGRSRPVKYLAVLLFLFGNMPVIASANFTLVYENTCPIPISPSLIPTGGSLKIKNSTSLSAIGPNKVMLYTLPDGWEGFGLFGTGCISSGLGTRNCATGNCEGRDCTAEDSPVSTNYIISSDGYITMSAERGYNLGLEIRGMCVGCGCPSASCKAQLTSCPNDLRVLNSARAVIGCKPGGGLHFSESQCTIPGDYGTSTVRITCPLKNAIIKIRVSCQ